ncbi:hypothetical protein [Haloarcula sp. K1]|uniref:hypothetical protein n=1 Tax=Haloarcula sp. K1 TaxID=1622207 RepID=UPI0007BC40CE|nr:hypothetical protein [Haloarcula sp. K1]KZX46300.1 hypothetical protein AV929_16145 [Haloarcula sp. K1]
MKSTILINHDDVMVSGDDDRTEKAKAVEAAVEDLFDETDTLGPITVENLGVNLGAQRDDWEEGEPCPECGSTIISVMNLTEDRYVSESGKFEFVKKGDAIGPDTSYVCGNCVSFLKYSPATE